ncbi:general secretion pathway protein GspD [Mitsuaria sp. WAJ17]|uniref:cohesin domain-containing protein n=1 Tax=Mitsuaria sp. WAJ17 TaxID=2761452 RepID=UPI001602A419|nr:cohesin domain-containing protein [Mitsuaria sp. WAJ17]MBB2487008.1 general secretion pathway protein GspD [Mitsuaria sp. WAJ17]
MTKFPDARRLRARPGCRWLGLTLLLALAGCAGDAAFREGQALMAQGQQEAGLAKLQQAVQEAPRNAEFRMELLTRREAVVRRALMDASGEARAGRLSEAEKHYQKALGLDPENAVARQGMQDILRDRRHLQVLAVVERELKAGATESLPLTAAKLRQVLLENPRSTAAQYWQARVEALEQQQLGPDKRLAAAYRKPVSLEFRDAPLKSVLEVLAKVAGLNFFYDRDVRPDLRATVIAKQTTVEDALRLLLTTNQLEQRVLNANSLLIYPSTPQKLKEYQALSVRTFFLANGDVKAVSNLLKTIVKAKDMVVDERLGTIVMRDTPEALRLAERIVALHDVADPEVMLDVEIMEVKRSRLMELGVQWPGQLSLAPLTTGTDALTLSQLAHLRPSTVKATVGPVAINARKEDQDANILANPRIRVRNKEKARIQIGDKVPVITTTSTSTGFVSESVSYVDVGLKLEVEPQIRLDQEVAIKVNLEVSNLVREIVSKTGTLSYQIGQRAASTTLQLRDGETQVLAGLINSEERVGANKVPGLGELPIAGRLFGSSKDDTQRSEILLSITPRILRSLQRPSAQQAELLSGTEAAIGMPELKLDAVPEAKEKPEGTAAPAAAVTRPPESAGAERAGPGVALKWQGPAAVRVGEQFTLTLHISSEQALLGLPLVLGFDPKIVQPVSVQEGSFFKQGGGSTAFSHRLDVAQGKVFAAITRDGANGVNGQGGVVQVAFRALAAATGTGIALSAATPTPEQGLARPLPLVHSLVVTP